MRHFPDAVQYHYNQFPDKINLSAHRLLKPLSAAAAGLARYDQILQTMHNSEILLAPLRNREAVISSRIEGTISTIDDVLNYEADMKQAKEAPNNSYDKKDTQEVSLYSRALLQAQEALKHGAPLNSFLIRQIHQLLLEHGRGAHLSPGSFKTEQNYLGSKNNEISFVPISPALLPQGIDRLFAYINHDGSDELIKAAIAHVEFEALHPFKDGNGRIGRMLIPLMLWRFGRISSPCFYISDYFDRHRDAYIQAMRNVSGQSAWTEWVIFFLHAMDYQAQANLDKANSIRQLYDSLKEPFRQLLKSEYYIKALDFLFTEPVFDNSTFTDEKNSGIPSRIATRFTQSLKGQVYLKTLREGVGRRPARYSFEPLMEILRV